ncbi:rho GTPase-activating protein SYDE1 isoform X2 [Takifugu flavidus]|uniref:rho GTPase-activating protein SYDE1 isoform X2 n=1 Tax=Takifugu flavidus TaxID=433684 RepID=UPI002544CE64|nr:rho GTPase-activating protein SYDE1 isoform X2 [Takifugu flavidus]
MAEPLLKRTFSRLRGRERSRRKSESKRREVEGELESSSSSMTTSRTLTAAGSDPSSPRPNITVAKKQSWARHGSEAPPTGLQSSSTPGTLEWLSGVSQDPLDPPRNETEQCCELTCMKDTTSASRDAMGSAPVHLEASQAAKASSDLSTTTTVNSKSAQHAYLQSLDHSSRAWVLSSGKPQGSSVALSEETGSNIWYNPIPEEEDAAGASTGVEIWRRRDEMMKDTTTKRTGQAGSRADRSEPADGFSSRQPGEGTNVGHHPDDCREEHPTSDCGSTSQKNRIDRLRSPGTVRKLSLKMKKLPELRRKLSLRSSSRSNRQETDASGGDQATSSSVTSPPVLSNQNVLSRYHLDSSTPAARPQRRPSRGCSGSKGGHLSDGDSPELLPRQQAAAVTPSQEMLCDVTSFQLYLGSNLQRCSQRVTGLLTVHLLGLEAMKTSRSEDSKEVFLAIQVDGVTRARTAPLALRGPALSLNHAFHLELERAQLLRIILLTPANIHGDQKSCGPIRNKVCCLGGVSIPPLFKATRSQQLCVKLEPRGLLYVKLSLQEKWDTQPISSSSGPTNVFGVELHHLVEKEESPVPIPLLIQKCVKEIEVRGLRVVGLYRLCGSAAVKKELRDWFERNSSAVCLSEDLYPDINVITGILKDYLRELPSQLITRTLYQVVREAMVLRPPPAAPVSPDPELAQRTVELLSCLPPPERATLSLLLDHLSLVASFSSFNRMTHQNLAVCFGPVLLTPTQEAWRAAGGLRGTAQRPSLGEEFSSAVDFKRHIEALHYLLQLWPVPTHRASADDTISPRVAQTFDTPDQQQDLTLLPEEEAVVSRRSRGGTARLESPPPINRYAGDWSVCGPDLLLGQEADYDEVAGSESDGGSRDEEHVEEEEEEEEDKLKPETWPSGERVGLYVEELLDFDAPFNCRLSLKDFDTLIHDLDREFCRLLAAFSRYKRDDGGDRKKTPCSVLLLFYSILMIAHLLALIFLIFMMAPKS